MTAFQCVTRFRVSQATYFRETLLPRIAHVLSTSERTMGLVNSPICRLRQEESLEWLPGEDDGHKCLMPEHLETSL